MPIFDMQVITVPKQQCIQQTVLGATQHDTHLWFDYQKMEVPGNLRHPPVPQDMRHMELHRGWSLDLPHNLEQMLHHLFLA